MLFNDLMIFIVTYFAWFVQYAWTKEKKSEEKKRKERKEIAPPIRLLLLTTTVKILLHTCTSVSRCTHAPTHRYATLHNREYTIPPEISIISLLKQIMGWSLVKPNTAGVQTQYSRLKRAAESLWVENWKHQTQKPWPQSVHEHRGTWQSRSSLRL